jgi:hypothetical protein
MKSSQKKDNAKFQVKFSTERLYHVCDPLQTYQLPVRTIAMTSGLFMASVRLFQTHNYWWEKETKSKEQQIMVYKAKILV